MSGRLSYIGTIKRTVDIDELRDVVSAYVRNRGHLINLSGVDDNSFTLDAKPDALNCYHGMRITFTVIKKSEEKYSFEVRGKLYVTSAGWAWMILHIILTFATFFWCIVAIILSLGSQKKVKAFFNDVVTDSKNNL